MGSKSNDWLIGSVDGLVASSHQPLPESMLRKIRNQMKLLGHNVEIPEKASSGINSNLLWENYVNSMTAGGLAPCLAN